jgi:starch synthase
MLNLKVLYISSAISPFVKNYEPADIVEFTSKAILENGFEVRGVMPKYGSINDRRNKLHEVLRLSDINIPIYNQDRALSVKVASLRQPNFQVYFIDNVEYFNRKGMFKNKDGKFYTDNDERMAFFCAGAIKSTRQLQWFPDIVHCNDWMAALVPFYLKTLYKDDEAFSKSKIVFTIHDTPFTYQFNESINHKLAIEGLDVDIVKSLGIKNFADLITVGAKYSDFVTKSFEKFDKAHEAANTALESIKPKYLPNVDNAAQTYADIYQALVKNEKIS